MNKQLYENYVLSIVKCGSLTNAAKELHISQPALSQGLSCLEKEIGIVIFNRKTSPLSLTPEGQLYYDHIRRVQALDDSFAKELSDFRSSQTRPITIGSPAAYVSSLLIPCMRALKKENRDINPFYIKTSSMEEMMELCSHGDIDCFICTRENLPDHFIQDLIYQEEIVLCAPKDCPITGIHDPRISDYPFIFLDRELPLQQKINDYLAREKINVHTHITTDQTLLALEMTKAGLGLSFASRSVAALQDIKTFPVDIMGRNIYIAYDKDMYLSHACQTFITYIKNLYTKTL